MLYWERVADKEEGGLNWDESPKGVLSNGAAVPPELSTKNTLSEKRMFKQIFQAAMTTFVLWITGCLALK